MIVYLGERVTMRFRVDNCEGKDFGISRGDYVVKIGEQVEYAGKATVEDHELSFLFTPDKIGIHTIEIWYEIGSDRRKGEFVVEVIE